MSEFIDEINKERTRQIEKWGDVPRSRMELLLILTEEIGEVAREIHDLTYQSEYDHVNGSIERLRTEVVQAAAVLKRIYDQANEIQERIDELPF